MDLFLFATISSENAEDCHGQGQIIAGVPGLPINVQSIKDKEKWYLYIQGIF